MSRHGLIPVHFAERLLSCTRSTNARIENGHELKRAKHFGPVYLREQQSGWTVGTSECNGLPVPSADAAIALADTWMRLTNADDVVVLRADGTSSEHGEREPYPAFEDERA